MTGSPAKRTERLAGQIQAELSGLLLRGAVRDPIAAEAIISQVELSGDLRHAKIFVRLLDPEASERRRQAVVRALTRAAPFLRRELGNRIRVKHTPELKFLWNAGVDHALRVEQVLEEIHREERADEPSDDGRSEEDDA